ncbi:hypothetical protein MBM_01228 [Drepanopeziza brunnea f. sp. 'multigermtubi' MB_m1]|uniref:Uncharacterized protein n=1 Tax=Marssonina brunnea f. sp. multigermtubi (strain MB_m1) TaxID=1072389 RepID=K1X5Y2_MARBU|nr:uncharacterized protein MBM_01228 [Drepanopeziza brunnea f. sp. 'multigermtubi' MB_m1]EKD20546.1 hypothetical protein MBM_01228 [Drepanopeziza brunnea f. sp. 'multigermtubi' MB_m1]
MRLCLPSDLTTGVISFFSPHPINPSAQSSTRFMLLGSSGNFLAVDSPLEHFKRSQGLLEGDFIARLVDSDEGEVAGLLHLAVDESVAGRDIHVSSAVEAWGLDFFNVDFPAEPVAAVAVGLRRNKVDLALGIA